MSSRTAGVPASIKQTRSISAVTLRNIYSNQEETIRPILEMDVGFEAEKRCEQCADDYRAGTPMFEACGSGCRLKAAFATNCSSIKNGLHL